MKSWTTTTKIGQHGNSLVCNVTGGCRALNLDRGDYVKVTIERAGKTYEVRSSESGDVIDIFSSIEDARKCIADYEDMDRRDNLYTPNWYEIYDPDEQKVIE